MRVPVSVGGATPALAEVTVTVSSPEAALKSAVTPHLPAKLWQIRCEEAKVGFEAP